MKKVIYSSLTFIILIVVLSISYLSIIGIETTKFNNEISNQVKKIDNNLSLELNKIKLVLDLINLKIDAKTISPQLKHKAKYIEIESLKSQISLNSIFNQNFSLENLEISTKLIKIKNLISFIRVLNKSTELYILERFVKKGSLITDIKIEFDSDGNIKNNYKIKGQVKDAQISFLTKYNLDRINFRFNINNENFEFQEINILLNGINFFSEKIFVKKVKNYFLVDGNIKNRNIKLDRKNIEHFVNPYFPKLDIRNIEFKSENKFSFKINKKKDINDFQFSSNINLENLSFLNIFNLEKFFPNIKKQIDINKHLLKIDYKKNNLSIEGGGDILFQKTNDKIKYQFENQDKVYKFQTSLIIKDNPFVLSALSYKKNKNTKLIIDVKGNHILNKHTLLKKINIGENDNIIKLEDLLISKDFKIQNLKSADLNFLDNESIRNNISVKKKKDIYYLSGPIFNANQLINNLINKDDDKTNIFEKNLSIKLNIDLIYLDNEHKVKDLKGNLDIFNNEISKANLKAYFFDDKEMKFTINKDNENKITTLFLGNAEPIIKRYKFIKGFKDGSLDFYSTKKGNKSNSIIKIYDFKLRELSVLTKLLTLASLQGIADTLTGEGIRFNEFEMNFDIQKNLMTINEIYAIGPAISVLMDGYIQKNEIISLRGTLVPATTLNKVIGSIPFLGKILVGPKSGEGVFGVSFKIKGPPKKLETTVNPIKTLTPRFITRTIEKIKTN